MAAPVHWRALCIPNASMCLQPCPHRTEIRDWNYFFRLVFLWPPTLLRARLLLGPSNFCPIHFRTDRRIAACHCLGPLSRATGCGCTAACLCLGVGARSTLSRTTGCGCTAACLCLGVGTRPTLSRDTGCGWRGDHSRNFPSCTNLDAPSRTLHLLDRPQGTRHLWTVFVQFTGHKEEKGFLE